MASEEPLFDPSLKKRKKKKVNFDEDPLGADAAPAEPETPAVPPPAETAPAASILKGSEPPKEDDLDAMFGDLKKKKKKKEIPLDLELASRVEWPETKFLTLVSQDASVPASGDATPATGGGDDPGDFGGIKKKKKKGTKSTFDLEAFEKELADSKAKEGDDEEEDGPVPDIDEGDLGEDVFAQPVTDGGAQVETWHGTDRDYTYPELLGRFYQILRAQNPELAGEKRRYTIVPPSVHRDGNKKTVFANISEICKRMHRQPDHVIQFLFAELGTTGSVDGSQRLVIKGRFQPKQLENVLRRYIVEYVTCKTCKSPDTILTKENRIYFMSCESCGSRRSVSAIKAGFQAQVGKRSRTKAAT
ncbi:unnamed protein product [Rhizoctonia solani]|uniref:Translation initiation factor IF2/IF5 domain-containing protein n=1 Tax=Rhizoctonia solani TaxID=456999 RepID=A0A8H2XUT3_9AGAM|nr:unnamed protein product [Rhizoctonia solani]